MNNTFEILFVAISRKLFCSEFLLKADICWTAVLVKPNQMVVPTVLVVVEFV